MRNTQIKYFKIYLKPFLFVRHVFTIQEFFFSRDCVKKISTEYALSKERYISLILKNTHLITQKEFV